MKKRNLGGRPPFKDRSIVRDKRIKISFTKAEYEKCKLEMLETCYWSFSNFMHRRVTEPDYVFKTIVWLNPDIVPFQKIGIRINEIAHDLNSGKIQIITDLLNELKPLMLDHMGLINEMLERGAVINPKSDIN